MSRWASITFLPISEAKSTLELSRGPGAHSEGSSATAPFFSVVTNRPLPGMLKAVQV